jgi:hypothetical protein
VLRAMQVLMKTISTSCRPCQWKLLGFLHNTIIRCCLLLSPLLCHYPDLLRVPSTCLIRGLQVVTSLHFSFCPACAHLVLTRTLTFSLELRQTPSNPQAPPTIQPPTSTQTPGLTAPITSASRPAMPRPTGNIPTAFVELGCEGGEQIL